MLFLTLKNKKINLLAQRKYRQNFKIIERFRESASFQEAAKNRIFSKSHKLIYFISFKKEREGLKLPKGF